MSRALGANDEEHARTVSSTGLLLAALSGTILSLTLLPLCEKTALFLGGGASPDLLKYSSDYLRVILYSVPFSVYATALYNQIRLCGNAKDAMIGLMSGMLINMVLDPIFIFPCKMGFIGAGWATFAGQIIGALVLTGLSMKNGNIKVSFKSAKLTRDNLYHIFIGGAPNFSRQGITSVAAVLLNIVASGYGEEAIAALTVAGRIAAMCYMIMIGWGQGFQPICAMNYGAGKYERVKKALRLSVCVGTVFLALADFVLYLEAPYLVSLMTKNPDVAANAVTILHLQCVSLPVMGVYALSSMFMQNIGHYYTALWISIARQGIFYIPLLYVIPAVFNVLTQSVAMHDPFGLYLVQPAADLLSCAFALILAIPEYRKLHQTS